jgi:anti-anti-sigma factor
MQQRTTAGGRSTMKTIRITTERAKDHATLRLAGWLVGGPGAIALSRRIRRLLTRGVRAITVDLAAARVIDCAGIGLLLRCRREAIRRGAVFRVARTPATIRRMLVLSDLLDLLEGEAARGPLHKAAPGHDAPLLLSA